MRDVMLAAARLGGIDGRCRWLLDDFVPHDPDSLSAAERALARDNLAALAFGHPSVPASITSSHSFNFKDPVLTDDASLRAVWQEIGRLANAHRDPVPSRIEGAFRAVARMPYVRLRLWHRDTNLAATLIYSVRSLFEACERLRECPECHRLFVANRRQERHPQCARKARDARRPSRAKGGN